MQEFLKVLVVVMMALPFVYMAYDVFKDLIVKLYQVLVHKAKPAMLNVISSLFN